MCLVGGNQRPHSCRGEDFRVPVQQQVSGFLMAGGGGASRDGALLPDCNIFLQVRPYLDSKGAYVALSTKN